MKKYYTIILWGMTLVFLGIVLAEDVPKKTVWEEQIPAWEKGEGNPYETKQGEWGVYQWVDDKTKWDSYLPMKWNESKGGGYWLGPHDRSTHPSYRFLYDGSLSASGICDDKWRHKHSSALIFRPKQSGICSIQGMVMAHVWAGKKKPILFHIGIFNNQNIYKELFQKELKPGEIIDLSKVNKLHEFNLKAGNRLVFTVAASDFYQAVAVTGLNYIIIACRGVVQTTPNSND